MDLTSLHLPKEPGVYIMKGAKGQILYVGKAKNLHSRVRQYFKEGGDGREMIPHLMAQVEHIETIIALSEKEALLLENSLIKQHKPKYNVLLKDDKTYISLMINPAEKWPMLKLIRFKGKPKGKGLYFGPYTSGFAARQTYETLIRTFPLRQCSNRELEGRKRPCLLYGMKRCIAPCTNMCTKEEYDEHVQAVIRFLKGSDTTLINDLEKRRKKHSDELEFEKAAILHEQIKSLKTVTEHHRYTVRFNIEDTDIIAFARGAIGDASIAKHTVRGGRFTDARCFYIAPSLQPDEDLLSTFILQHYSHISFPTQIFTQLKLSPALPDILEEMGHHRPKVICPHIGEKKKLIAMAEKNAKVHLSSQNQQDNQMQELLLKLQETCQLENYPTRIECFDTSHMSLENPVASMAVYLDGQKSKSESRLYKIKHAEKSEDYYSMREALHRRLSRGKKEEALPDLIILDGGKGQLGLAKQILAELDIISCDVIALAKENARHDKGLSAERIFTLHQTDPISLPTRSPLQFFLQKVRDEAHKMAIEYHRKRKRQSLVKSSLDEIPGIGPAKRKALLTHFGSLSRIKKASFEELLKVPGISEKNAQTILSAYSE